MSRRTLLSVVAAAVAVLVLTAVALTTRGEARPRPAYRITIHASASTVQAGQVVSLSGKVRPVTRAMLRQAVKLQVTSPNGVVGTRTDRPDPSGAYAFTESFKAPGTYLVRARIAPGKDHGEGISQQLKVTVVPLSVP